MLEGLDSDLVVLPELAVSGYNFESAGQARSLGEPADGPTARMLSVLAAETGAHYVIGIAEAEGNALYNSAILVGPGGLIGCYRKAHLFFHEKDFFLPGNSGFRIFEVNGIKLGLLVCFDHMFPEAARTLALGGAQIICHPSNLVIPEYAQLTTRVRALENRVFWLLSNRTGPETGKAGELVFTGESQIVASNGSVPAKAGATEETVISAEIDPGKAKDKKVTALNDLFEDRREELYRLRRDTL
jgi:predicted amidohydrolase